jgi:hypothetical protein
VLGDLKIGQPLSELSPLFRVFQGSIESALSDTDLSGNFNSALIEDSSP